MRLADLVASTRDALLADFAARARKWGDTRGISRIELLDSIPEFLDELVVRNLPEKGCVFRLTLPTEVEERP